MASPSCGHGGTGSSDSAASLVEWSSSPVLNKFSPLTVDMSPAGACPSAASSSPLMDFASGHAEEPSKQPHARHTSSQEIVGPLVHLTSPPLSSPGCNSESGARRMWHIDDFELGPRIGTGTFGHVRRARERKNKIDAALKILKKRRIERLRVQRHIVHEIDIQRHLCHPNILRHFGFFWDATCVYMILEYACDGDLYSILRKQACQKFDEPTAAGCVAQMASALAYCHQMHVIHRDVKPHNVLLVGHRRLKLADFGWAVHTYPDDRRWTLCGTHDYLPPEMVDASNGHSFGVDSWGLGVSTYELLVGQPPFVAQTFKETYRRILAAAPSFPEAMSETACAFVAQLLARDPASRMGPSGACDHRWLRQTEAGESRIAALAGA